MRFLLEKLEKLGTLSIFVPKMENVPVFPKAEEEEK